MLFIDETSRLGKDKTVKHDNYREDLIRFDNEDRIRFDTDYAVKNINIIGKPPKVIGWAGPARSGTTSLLFLLAGHSKVAKVFFQPIKTILRKGGPELNLHEQHSTVCLKEVFRSCCPSDDHDPIKVLLDSGVPPQNITWIAMLRNPFHNYASWTQHITFYTPEDYAAAQEYTVKIYEHYKKIGLNIVPFAYDLLLRGESKVVDALLSKIGLESFNGDLSFKSADIDKKINYGQAKDPNYFKMSIQPTLERKKFIYTANKAVLDELTAKKIKELCWQRYEDFYELSKRELQL